jgi:hypothetical protein
VAASSARAACRRSLGTSCARRRPDCRCRAPLKARTSRPSWSDTATSVPTVSAAAPLRADRRRSSPPHRPFASRRSSSPRWIPITGAHTTTSDFLRPPPSSLRSTLKLAGPPLCIYPIRAFAVYMSPVRTTPLAPCRRLAVRMSELPPLGVVPPSATVQRWRHASGRRTRANAARECSQRTGRWRGLRFSRAVPSYATGPLWATWFLCSRPHRYCASGLRADFGPVAFVSFFSYFLIIFKSLLSSKICKSLIWIQKNMKQILLDRSSALGFKNII